MTTLPDRIKNIIYPIQNILEQSVPLDVLYLHIPMKTLKGKVYNIPLDFEDNFVGYKTKFIINRCSQDYGPITKLAPTLELEKENDTYIFTFDDDIIVHKDVVKILKRKIKKYPDTCLGFSGVCLGTFPFYFQFVINNKKDHYVDWIQGVHVVCYKRSFFTTINELVTFGDNTKLKKFLVFNDDHRISSYLASKKIKKMSIGYNIQKYLFKYEEKQVETLSSRHTLFKEHYQIINYFYKIGLYNLSYDLKTSLIFYIILFCILSLFTLSFKNINIILRIIFLIIVMKLLIYNLQNHFDLFSFH